MANNFFRDVDISAFVNFSSIYRTPLLPERFELDEIAFQKFFLPGPFLWVDPDLIDYLTCNVLWVETEERCDPGDRLPLVRGRPHVPADQVVQQEWQQHHRSPTLVGSVCQV